MATPMRHVLMIGATSGIGRAMSDRLVQKGSKVIAVGRRQDRLDEFVTQHGHENAQAMCFDISQPGVTSFAKTVTETYPDLDCVFLNAGVQEKYDFGKPDAVNLSQFHAEININFTSFVNLTHAFLPFLLGKKMPTAIVYTGSNLAYVPAATLPAYSASKAALSAFILCLREQLRDTTVRIVELSPPPVQTELHDSQMGVEAGRKLGMPVDQFTDLAYEALQQEDQDQIIIGSVGPEEPFHDIVNKRRKAFHALAKMMRGEK